MKDVQIDWDQIPEGVSAVLEIDQDQPTYCMAVKGVIYYQFYRYSAFKPSRYHSYTYDDLKRKFGNKFHIRPQK